MSTGSLQVIGIGPGSQGDRTKRAEAAILAADIVVGYHGYLERIRDLLSGKETFGSGMRAEIERVQEAVRLAVAGKRVALVSSGDAGVYGMAGLALETAEAQGAGSLPIEIIPGVTAASAAAALLGAPLMCDFAVISLSDLLVPLERIMMRLKAVIGADMVVALYNPRSHSRTDPFDQAMAIIRAHRPPTTLVGIARALGQAEESTTIAQLGELNPEVIDMHTVLLIGNSQTRRLGHRMVNPRGYQVEV